MKPDYFGASDRLELAQSGNKHLRSGQLAASRTRSAFALCFELKGRANPSLERTGDAAQMREKIEIVAPRMPIEGPIPGRSARSR